MKYFAAPKLKDIITLILFVALCFLWILVDQIFLKEASQRFIALVVIVIGLFYLQFLVNKPNNTWKYANSLALILLLVSVALTLIMHLLVNHDLNTVYKHAIMICVICAAMPYLAGILYSISRRKE